MNSKASDRLLDAISRAVALQLWSLGAIRINTDSPFQLASGNYSPIYVDCRQVISSPSTIDLFVAAARTISDHYHLTFSVLAGGETAGIPFAAFLSRAFGLPMVYVRKQSKSHGLRSRVEGELAPGDTVLLVEDLVTDGASKLSFISALRDAKSIVSDALVLFDRRQGGKELLAQHGVRLLPITDISIALQEAVNAGLASATEITSVEDYLHSAKAWHALRGLTFTE